MDNSLSLTGENDMHWSLTLDYFGLNKVLLSHKVIPDLSRIWNVKFPDKRAEPILFDADMQWHTVLPGNH